MVSKSDTHLVEAVETCTSILERVQKDHSIAVEDLIKAEPFYAEINNPIEKMKLADLREL